MIEVVIGFCIGKECLHVHVVWLCSTKSITLGLNKEDLELVRLPSRPHEMWEAL